METARGSSVLRRYGKVAVVLAASCTLLAGVSPASADVSATSAESAARSTATRYLDGRLKSRVTLKNADRRSTVSPTDSTVVAEAFDDIDTAVAKQLGTGWSDYAMRTRFLETRVSGNTARVRVEVDADYHYKASPEIESGVYNVKYDLRLAKGEDGWRIVSIGGGDDDAVRFREAVAAKVSRGSSVRDAVRTLKQQQISSLPNVAMRIKRSAPRGAKSQGESHSIAATSRSYNSSNGAAYAQRFATVPEGPGRLFFTARGSDCTNFVSQCLWAAYGGYVSGDDATSRSNISNKVRMVSGVWQAGSGGAYTNWESVSNLWSYATDTGKSKGPIATGHNNNGRYWGISPSDVRVGNVLQLRQGNLSTYAHSVYVSIVVSGPGEPASWDRVYVCQHSNERKNRMASELIHSWSVDSPCYVRRMSFGSGTFDR